jgi:hypothetical protein
MKMVEFLNRILTEEIVVQVSQGSNVFQGIIRDGDDTTILIEATHEGPYQSCPVGSTIAVVGAGLHNSVSWLHSFGGPRFVMLKSNDLAIVPVESLPPVG